MHRCCFKQIYGSLFNYVADEGRGSEIYIFWITLLHSRIRNVWANIFRYVAQFTSCFMFSDKKSEICTFSPFSENFSTHLGLVLFRFFL